MLSRPRRRPQRPESRRGTARTRTPKAGRVLGTYSTWGRGSKPPCASGTYTRRAAGTRGPCVPYAGAGAHERLSARSDLVLQRSERPIGREALQHRDVRAHGRRALGVEARRVHLDLDRLRAAHPCRHREPHARGGAHVRAPRLLAPLVEAAHERVELGWGRHRNRASTSATGRRRQRGRRAVGGAVARSEQPLRVLLAGRYYGTQRSFP